MDDLKGRWATIKGRRVFIKEGQSLTEAMKESGKFGNNQKEQVSVYGNMKDIIKQAKEELEEYVKQEPDWEKRDPKKMDAIRKKMFDAFDKEVEKHKFYSEELEYIIKEKGHGDLTYKMALLDLDTIAGQEKFEIDTSPFSLSTYAIPKGGVVDWGSKPENSYRVSDHWNFESKGQVHCKLKDTDEYTQKVFLAKYINGKYEIMFKYE